MKNRDHYVYVVASTRESKACAPVKVGITSALKGRLATLQTGSPVKLVIAHYLTVPSRDVAEFVEGAFHHCNADARLSGEWFDIEPARAVVSLALYMSWSLQANGVPDDIIQQTKEMMGLGAALDAALARLRGEVGGLQ